MHIHASIWMPSGSMFYINDFVFSDDVNLSDKNSNRNTVNPNDNGIIELINNKGNRTIKVK